MNYEHNNYTNFNNQDFLNEKMRVVFYARVSTDQEEQLNSLRQQVEYFEEYIKKNNNWEFAGMYVDEGITGTIAKKRPEFMKMMQDGKERKFDLILTKEVSRFARNTVDTLQFTRELKKYGVCVIFTLDNINTFDKDGEFKLTLMASLAQDEARKTSERVRWGHMKNMHSGVVYGSNNILGYKVENGKLSIIEEEAKTVKLIFQLYLEGLGIRAIKMELEKRGILSPMGLNTWQQGTVMRILKNEKYSGDLVQKKFITVDFLDKKRKRNEGEEELIIIENSHEAIIDKETFNKVQAEIKRRDEITKKKTTNTAGRYSNKYPYSGKLICGDCGAIFKRKIWNKKKDGTYTYAWICGNRDLNGKKGSKNRDENFGCNAVGVPEYIIDEMLRRTIKTIFENKEQTIIALEIALEKSIKDEDYLKEISDIKKSINKYENQIEQLLEMKLEGLINKDIFIKKKASIEENINIQKELLKKYDAKIQSMANVKERLEKLKDLFNKEIDFNEKLPDEVVRLLVNHIEIKSKEQFDVFLNTDVSYNVFYDKLNFELQPYSINGMYRCKSKSSYRGII